MTLKSGLIILIATTLLANWQHASADEKLSHDNKTEIINKLAEALKNKYVLIDEGIKFGEEIAALNKAGNFEQTSNKEDFVEQVNKSLYRITNDKHISLRPEVAGQSGGMVRRIGGPESGGQAPTARRMVRVPSQNGQSLKAMMGLPDTASLYTEILPGNIGLLTVHDLLGTTEGVDRAMAELADTDGLIIDVRQCPGGSGNIAGQISSYFLAEGEEIMRMHTRGQDVMINRSVALPKGAKRYLDKPFYLVTSPFTGSACEALSFALKYHDLGIVYGETTAGAGHASTQGLTPIGYGLSAFIPNSKPEHPKHKGGFEKVGVSPDIETNSVVAVDQAHQMILSQLLEKNKNDSQLAEAIISVTSKVNQTLLEQVANSKAHADLLGQYDEQYKIIMDRGQLKLIGSSGRKYPLKKIEKDLFDMVYARNGQKIQIKRDEHSRVTGISLSPRKGQTAWKYKQKI